MCLILNFATSAAIPSYRNSGVSDTAETGTGSRSNASTRSTTSSSASPLGCSQSSSRKLQTPSTPLTRRAAQRSTRPRHEPNLDAYNPEGKTALHAAATKQNVECGTVLLESSAKLENVVSNGWTPIMTAIAHNSHALLSVFAEWYQNRLVLIGSTSRVEGSQLLPVIAESADFETIRFVTSAVSFLPLRLSLDLGGNTCAAD